MRRSPSKDPARLVVAALLVGGVAGSSVRAQTVLAPAWVHTEPGFTTDGIAVGDVNSTAGLEVVVLSEGSTWYQSPPTLGAGRAIVLSVGGAVRARFNPPAMRELMGLPLIEQLDTGTSEYLVGEFRSAAGGGAVYAVPGDASAATAARWILSPRGYPGYYNQGPSSGNLIGTSAGRELVVPAWDGLVQVLRRSDGAPLATYDVWAQHGENIYGHVAIGNVDNQPGEEIVLVGHAGGTVIALTPQADGSMTLAFESQAGGSYASGSGPAIADIDDDGYPEIIVALTGSPVVRAYDAVHSLTGDCEYEWAAPPGGNYYWTSPVAGDVDGDGVVEVVVQASNSTISVLTAEGVTSSPTSCSPGNVDVAAHVVGSGGPSWFTPALADVTGDNAPDIVAASYTTLEVLDISAAGAVNVAYRATDSTATFYPSATVVSGLGGGRAAIFVSGWVNGNVYRYDIPAGGTTPESWETTMGNNERTGFCCADTSCGSCGGGSCAQACGSGSCACDQPGCDCALDCTGSNCNPSCSDGTTCTIDCSNTNNCKPSCTDGSTCDIACDQLNNCKDVKCSGGSACGVSCQNTNNCDMACTDGSTCALDCRSSNNCTDIQCSGGSDCQVSCTNMNNCAIDCNDDSTCLLSCTSVNNCGFSSCQNETTCGSGVIACNRPCP